MSIRLITSRSIRTQVFIELSKKNEIRLVSLSKINKDMNLLFLCAMGERRSKTAEILFKATTNHNTRSAGLSPGSDYRITSDDIKWADIIFVMEKELIPYLVASNINGISKEVIILNIPDRFTYMDKRLVQLLKERVSEILN